MFRSHALLQRIFPQNCEPAWRRSASTLLIGPIFLVSFTGVIERSIVYKNDFAYPTKIHVAHRLGKNISAQGCSHRKIN